MNLQFKMKMSEKELADLLKYYKDDISKDNWKPLAQYIRVSIETGCLCIIDVAD